MLGKKHVNDDKDESYQRSRGRDANEKPDRNYADRERNVGHEDAEEHSRVPKGGGDAPQGGRR